MRVPPIHFKELSSDEAMSSKIEDLTSKYTAQQLADHLTALEAALVAKIHPADFHKLPEMSDALSRQTKLFNHSTFAIVSMILAAGEAKDRSRSIEYFVEVAKVCISLYFISFDLI